MAAEATIYSGRPPVSVAELATAAAAERVAIRFLDEDGAPLDDQPAGPLEGHSVVVGWASTDTATEAAVDAAIAHHDKDAIDFLGRTGKLGWCGLTCRPFSYQEFWAKYPTEIDEYDGAVDPEKLRTIKAATVRYGLRSSVRPAHCAELFETLLSIIERVTHGVVE
jgi:hypothetical protein